MIYILSKKCRLGMSMLAGITWLNMWGGWKTMADCCEVVVRWWDNNRWGGLIQWWGGGIYCFPAEVVSFGKTKFNNRALCPIC